MAPGSSLEDVEESTCAFSSPTVGPLKSLEQMFQRSMPCTARAAALRSAARLSLRSVK